MTAAAPGTGPASSPLARLAAEGATGALHGHAGALYLADGAVVHAESPVVPDVGRRLTAGGRLSAEAWEEAVAEGGPDYRAGRFLVEHGRLSRGELELCHLSALFDAAFFVLFPPDSSQRAPERFLKEARHWLGPVRPVPVPLLQRELRRRGDLLRRAWPWPEVDTAPVVPVPGAVPAGAPGAGPTCGRRAVLQAADGVRTPVQIARALGRSAFTTLLDVRRLAAAGLVRTPPPDTGPGAGPQARTPLPARTPAATVEVSLLYRIRDALEAL
ncbi:transcriptional regulator [Streptomyces triculaminicus]|uniref:Transcriptional regulator n=1 Tax=Streptomyces triculaminicus TaxID=2816232 RepID=A0A939JR66_9ACTN|nr:transcriptional regulator [Streptomyces triculaminicus]MBO0654000.1 transcriptional regulator [Streptomyces triculaminicus]